MFDDDAALAAGQKAIAQARVALGKDVLGPDDVQTYHVDQFVENLSFALPSDQP